MLSEEVQQLEHISQELQQRQLGFRKQASLLSFLESSLAGEALVGGGAYLAMKMQPALLRAAAELSARGKKISHFIQDPLRVIGGKKGLTGVQEGTDLGRRMREQGIPPEEASAILRQLGQFAAEVKQGLPKKEVDPVVNMYAKFHQPGSQNPVSRLMNEAGNKVLLKSGVPEDAKRHLGHDLAQYAYAIPGAYKGDFRLGVRAIRNTAQGYDATKQMLMNAKGIPQRYPSLGNRIPAPVKDKANKVTGAINQYID